MIDDQKLIKKAQKVLNPRQTSPTAEVGGVGCALVTDKGHVYTGVCIDTPCSMGFCAEHNAIGTMITQGESHIHTIVAVDWDGSILPPCGRCREFIYQIDEHNADTRVILQDNKIRTVKELLPEHWQENQSKE